MGYSVLKFSFRRVLPLLSEGCNAFVRTQETAEDHDGARNPVPRGIQQSGRSDGEGGELSQGIVTAMGGQSHADCTISLSVQVNEVKGVMTENIDRMLQRGEKLELLTDKTENLMSEVGASGGNPQGLGSI